MIDATEANKEQQRVLGRSQTMVSNLGAQILGDLVELGEDIVDSVLGERLGVTSCGTVREGQRDGMRTGKRGWTKPSFEQAVRTIQHGQALTSFAQSLGIEKEEEIAIAALISAMLIATNQRVIIGRMDCSL